MNEEKSNPTPAPTEEEPQVYAVQRRGQALRFNRREFLELSAVAAAAASLGGCGGLPQGMTSASTATPVSSRDTIVNFQNAPLFNGPGTGYERIAILKQNDVLRVISRSEDSNWLQVGTTSGDVGWISAAFVDLKVPVGSLPVDTGQPVEEARPAPTEPPAQPAAAPTRAPTRTTAPPKPTNTARPTSTTRPTSTATRAPVSGVTLNGVVVVEAANVRIAPILNIQAIINLQQGESVEIIGRTNDGVWVLVNTGKSAASTGKPLIGWMKANQLSVTTSQVDTLPIATPKPTPTPLPGSASSISPGDTGIKYNYTDEYGIIHTMTLPCGSALPAGAVCVCNCITVPLPTSECTCVGYCTCDYIHYWYPN